MIVRRKLPQVLSLLISIVGCQYGVALRNNGTIGSLTMEAFWPGYFTDWGVDLRFLIGNWYPVTTFDTILPSSLIQTSPNSNKYFRIGRCARADVYKCLKHGNSSNGLPKAVQGVWWQDGVDLDEEIITSAGIWDPETRTLTIGAGRESRVWAAHDTVSVFIPGAFWTKSGTSHLNWLASWRGAASIEFNEDITFGQIYGQSIFLNAIDFRVPAWLVNWTMTLMPDGSWRRQSYFLNMYLPTGDYVLRSIVTGDGKPGPAYPEWVKSRQGRPFIFLDDLP
eukprot:jgi/Botrbrau1/9783/Bobra.85_1s0027.1